MAGVKWTMDEINFLKKNYNNMDKKNILNELPNRNWKSIIIKASKNKIKRYNNKKRFSDMNILLNDDAKTFYWIGFIMADGNIIKNRLRIYLSINDEKHLIKFKNYIKFERELKYIKETKSCGISVMDKKYLSIFCEKFEINNRKTYNPPNFELFKKFDKKLVFSLIIGFIDGDGCIKKQYKRNDCNLVIHLHKSWLNNLIYIENFLYNYFDIEKNKNLSKIGNDKYSLLSLTNNRLLNDMKKECLKLDLPILDRKWDKIDLNFISRTEKSRMDKINFAKLLENNKNIGIYEICNKLNLKYSTAYKYYKQIKN